MQDFSLLFTKIESLSKNEKRKAIVECFHEQLQESNGLVVLVGYCSRDSLEKLNKLIFQKGIRNICLILGMYYFEGFPEKLYETIMRLNKEWMELQKGEIRITHSFKYHGKLYFFYKSGHPISAILGSANLSFLEEYEEKKKQYELATLVKEKDILNELSLHIEEIKDQIFSENISSLTNIRIVTKQEESSLEEEGRIQKLKSKNIFFLPLKVPLEKNKFNPDRSNYTRSNLNTCYGKPRRKGGLSRSWWEVQITVNKEIINREGYPKRGEWFYVITDDGHEFKAQVAGDNGKQFSAVGDEQLLGRWIKGRLVSLGIVSPIEDISLDINKEGMITKEMLEEYGGDQLVLKNNGEIKIDEFGKSRDVWYLSFPRKIS